MKGQNPSHITATASNTKLSEAELQEQGLRILARMIARCHVEKNSDSEVENGSKSDHEGILPWRWDPRPKGEDSGPREQLADAMEKRNEH